MSKQIKGTITLTYEREAIPSFPQWLLLGAFCNELGIDGITAISVNSRTGPVKMEHTIEVAYPRTENGRLHELAGQVLNRVRRSLEVSVSPFGAWTKLGEEYHRAFSLCDDYTLLMEVQG